MSRHEVPLPNIKLLIFNKLTTAIRLDSVNSGSLHKKEVDQRPRSDILQGGMKAARQFGIVVLLLASYLTPAMACMVSDVQMNAEERACCRAMKNQCEQMGMAASHGCCQKAPNSALSDAIVTKTITNHPVAVALVWLSAAESLNANSAVTGWIEHVDTSPPPSPPGSISILRI